MEIITKVNRLLREWRIKANYDKCYGAMEYAGKAVFGLCNGLMTSAENQNIIECSCVACPFLFKEKNK